VAVQCPHCRATVTLMKRHGLSGALCPECHQVVALGEDPPPPPSTPTPRVVRPLRGDARVTCRACGGGRDREARRCPACGEQWLYRVGALGVDDDAARQRLVEYVLHRQSKAVARERLEHRFRHFPAAIMSGLTEAQALRMRHDLENVGVQVAVEEDDAIPLHGPVQRFRFDWTWLVVPALLVFAVGVYLLVDSEREARRSREMAEARRSALPAPSAAPTSVGVDAPADVLRGVVEVENAGRHGFGVVVDRDGWVIAALALVDRAGGLDVVQGGQRSRASLVRRDERSGLGLFRLAGPAAFTVSLGDVTTVEPGAALFVAAAGDAGSTLARARAVRPDARRGARLFLALELERVAPPAVELPGAPVFNREGFVVAVLVAGQAGQGGAPGPGLAVPANVLVESAESLLAEIRAPRAPSPVFEGWRQRAETEARLAAPEVYETAEKRLLLGLTCDAARSLCEGTLGVLSFGGPPAVDAPIDFEMQSPEQSVSDREPRHGRQSLTPVPSAFTEVAPADSPLIQEVGVAARRAILGGDVDGIRLHVLPVTLRRPPLPADARFRIVASGLGGRRSAGTELGPPTAPAPMTEAPSAPPTAAASNAPPGPETPFGELKGREWADRFRQLDGDISRQTALIDQIRSQIAQKLAVAPGLLERETEQLGRLRERRAVLAAEADRWQVPADLRR
jgi:hypothetical protein